MKKVFRIVQFGANLGMIVVSLLLAFIVIDQYIIAPKKPDPVQIGALNSSQPALATTVDGLAGKVVPLQGVDWKDTNKTVVLYLSTTCHFCAESSPFYKRLVGEKSNLPFKLVAVFPEKTDEANKYLQSHEIKADQVINGSLSSIGVTATPTLMLVDENGVISDSWRGRLTEDKESEVVAKLYY